MQEWVYVQEARPSPGNKQWKHASTCNDIIRNQWRQIVYMLVLSVCFAIS